jgi:hypothetical protein
MAVNRSLQQWPQDFSYEVDEFPEVNFPVLTQPDTSWVMASGDKRTQFAFGGEIAA